MTLTAIVGLLSVSVQSGIESQSRGARPFLVGRPHPALVGIDALRAVLLRSGGDPSADGLDWTQLKEEVTGELHQANIELVAGPLSGMSNIPELRVYIHLLKLGDSRQYVFRIQTSVARSVCLEAGANPIFKADLWMLNPAFEAVSVDDMPSRIIDVALGQVKIFVRAYQVANPEVPFLSGSGKSQARPAEISQNQTATDPKVPTTRRGYVASTNSDIFHKPECRWAKNIAPENLVIYENREEAIRAGKRPCKWCRP
jgi:hypothetical protein